MSGTERCRDCGVELRADNVWEPGTCLDCAREITAAEIACPLQIKGCHLWAADVDLHYLGSQETDPCVLCGDPVNHFGHDHGQVTGDGLTRAAFFEVLDDIVDEWHEGAWDGRSLEDVIREKTKWSALQYERWVVSGQP